MLDFVVTRRRNLLGDGNGVDVIGGGRVGDVDAGAVAQLDQAFDQVVRAFWAFMFEHRFERVKPLAGFFGVWIDGNGGHDLFLLLTTF